MNFKKATAVKEKFTELFDHQPGMYFSPGRINLIGEHIDYNDGFVLPAAIDKGVYFAIAPNQSNSIHFFATDFNEAFSVDLNAIEKNSSWRNYVLSVVNEFLIAAKNIGGFNCVLGGDIPIGAGMSSSAAIEGGLAFALNTIFDCGYNRKELALLCQRAEHNYPGVNCGIMDMYASILGKEAQVILLDCKKIEHQYFPMNLGKYQLVLVNSMVHHSLAAGEYNIRRKNCEEGLAILKSTTGVTSFRDITSVTTIEDNKAGMTAPVFDCCKYVVEEIQRTIKAAALLQENNIEAFGKLMFDTHEGLSQLYKVSCDELDFLVAHAKKNTSVIGSRLMGGGFGGCTINIVEEENVSTFIEEAAEAFHKQFNKTPEVYILAISDGVNQLTTL